MWRKMVSQAEKVFKEKLSKEKTFEQIEKERMKHEKEKEMRYYQDLFSPRFF